MASRVLEGGALRISSRLTIPAEEISLRVTASGGPGGQHANRSLTAVVASFRLDQSAVLRTSERERLREVFGDVVRSSASRFRSQGANREAALEQLASRLAQALQPRTPRRATTPTKASQVRRVEEKKARGRVKQNRRSASDD